MKVHVNTEFKVFPSTNSDNIFIISGGYLFAQGPNKQFLKKKKFSVICQQELKERKEKPKKVGMQ